MRDETIGSGLGGNDRIVGRVDHGADETADRPLVPVGRSLDNVDPGIRAVGKVEFGAIGINEANVERS
jgi:hypothetical protein